MKKEIHPEYRPVIFKDVSCDFEILTRSTMTSDETIEWKDGNTYPLIKVQISSGSHPFFTGKQRVVDTAGRIDRFKKKFGDRVALGSQKKKKTVPFRLKKLETKKTEEAKKPEPEAKPEAKTEE